MTNDSTRQTQIAVLAMGDMGSWVARRLTAHGAAVRTVLAGRSEASAARALAAGVQDAGSDLALVEGADVLLSIVPPAAALALADRLAPVLAQARVKPVYVDCNAISRTTMRAVEERIEATGCEVADAGIFGSAPPGGGTGPRIYLSGAAAGRVTFLAGHGLDLSVLDAPVGSASALKCCFAALSKGVIALGTEAVLAATQAGVADALRKEVETHVPDLARLLQRLTPQSYGKAHRWVAEMEEIGHDFAGVPGGPGSYHAAAELFSAVAAAVGQRGAPGNLVDEMDAFITGLKPR